MKPVDRQPICLVNLPRGVGHPYAPLGLLCLKGALDAAAIPSLILDAELLFRSGKLPRDRTALLEAIVRAAAEMGAGSYGITADCSSYPLAIRFAQCLKKSRPEATIVLGGPHATFVARETLAAFPEVDIIVIGEGEETLPELAGALARGADLRGIPGLVFRAGEEIVATAARPPCTDLDRFPRPAFDAYPVSDLAALFPPPDQPPLLPVEAGRGCPKACAFCATSRIWGRPRTRAPQAVADEMADLHCRYGIGAFELIHDNIASDPDFLPGLCDCLIARGSPFVWSCSISTDLLDLPLVERMSMAGCTGLFVGIESASPAVQRSIGKRQDLERTEVMLHDCLRRGMTVGTGFIVGFPGETLEDLDLTILMATRLRQAGVEIRLSQLSLFPGTPLCRRHLGEAVLEERYSGTSLPLVDFDGQRELIAGHPELFSSFYTLPVREWEGTDIGWLVLFFETVWLYFPQPLANVLTAAAGVGDGPVGVFRSWDRWRAAHRPEGAFTPDFVFYSFNDFLEHYDGELARRRDEGGLPGSEMPADDSALDIPPSRG